MFYVDTSSLLKLLLPEPESAAVQVALVREDIAVVSVLAELEAEIQLRADRLAGLLTKMQYRRLVERLATLTTQQPFDLRTLPGSVFQTALRQHRTRQTPHVRAMDRLHLAAMEELGVRRS